MANINVTPTSGSGNKDLSITGGCNSGLDIQKKYRAFTSVGGVSKEFTVVLEGKREEFLVKSSDGTTTEVFNTSDGSPYAVVKEAWKSNPNC